jgi:diadenosine tetraphosphate (Ap4A) HIT family hydrolase
MKKKIKKKKECPFCFDDVEKYEYKSFIIKKYNYWRVELSRDICHLKGKCLIILKNHKEDFFDICPKQAKEFFDIAKALRDVIKNLYGTDMFNYESLGNSIRHLHVHVTPRYKKEKAIKFPNFKSEFKDNFESRYEEFNHHYIPDKILFKIRDDIKNKLE